MWLEIILRGIETLIVISGAVGAAIAGRFYIQAQKHQATAEAKDEIINLLTASANGWKARYESEHVEITNYRAEVHTRNDENNARILELTNQNSSLKSKTDLSPVLAFQKEQSTVNSKVVEALNIIIKHLRPRQKKAARAKSKR